MRGELWRWTVRGSGLGVGLLLVYLVAIVAQLAVNVIVLTLVSILLAAALGPLVSWTRERIGISRAVAILGVYVIVLVLTAFLLLLVIPAAINQMTELSERVPEMLEETKAWAAALEPAIIGTTLEQFIVDLEMSLSGSGGNGPEAEEVVQVGLTAADAVISVITVLTLVFFWLTSRELMQRFALALLPGDLRGGIREAWNDVEARMGYWLRGQLVLMATIGVMTTVAYFILGLENALLLGLIAGIAEVIPIVGPAIGAIPALIVAFLGGGPELALIVAGVYVVIQVVEGNVLVPIVMKNAVGLPPFIVIVSLLVGAAVAGLIGALLAVPIAAAMAVVLERAQARAEPVSLAPTDAEPETDDPPGDPEADEESGA